MKTLTKTKSKTKVALTVGVLLAAGGAAYALTGTLGSVGYNNFYVECYNGSSLEDNGSVSIITKADGTQMVAPSAGCQPSKYWQTSANMFCNGKVSNRSGKVGINSYKIKKYCKIREEDRRSYGYGYQSVQTYGYNPERYYGYNSPAGSNTASNDSATTPTSSYKKAPTKKTSFIKNFFFRKK